MVPLSRLEQSEIFKHVPLLVAHRGR